MGNGLDTVYCLAPSASAGSVRLKVSPERASRAVVAGPELTEKGLVGPRKSRRELLTRYHRSDKPGADLTTAPREPGCPSLAFEERDDAGEGDRLRLLHCLDSCGVEALLSVPINAFIPS